MATIDSVISPHTAAERGLKWDGRDFPYRPGAELNISPGLELFSPEEAQLDPVTYEVISTKLWNINEEHAETIKRASGSPVVAFHDDFNTCIMTEAGDPFLFAPYIQYFSGNAEYIIKYTLENRSANPMIEPGDMFVHNDCFIAGSHQQDIALYAPIFVEGKLFCWVFNACHVRDIGGVEAGSFCVQAPNIYWDPPAVRAMKLVDQNGIREDAYDTLLRFSRLPHLLAMELRSQIAGITRSRTRIEELVERYGPSVIRAVMSKTIDDTADAVRERLSRLPDGRWSETTYMSGAVPGDTAPHKAVLTLEKRGGELFFSNHGTDAQTGCINCSFGQWRSAIGSSLAQMLAFDHRFVVAGVHRVTHFEPDVGTITAIDRDGATSCLWAQVVSIYMAGKVLSKMVYPDAELRQGIIGSSPLCGCGWMTQAGIDQNGNEFSTVMLDHVGGGLGAFSFRDGIDQGGATFWPKVEIGDAEAWEQYFPVLYLYRQAGRNGGHGKFRGGHGLHLGFVGHGTPEQTATLVSQNARLSTQFGLSGGHWANTGDFFTIEGSSVRSEFARGNIPSSPEQLRELEGKPSLLAAKAMYVPFGENDVIEHITFGGGGYGDPLERDPELVASELVSGDVTADAVASVYGVVIAEDGSADLQGTEKRREEMRGKRLADAHVPSSAALEITGELTSVCDIAEALSIARDEAGAHVIRCRRCGEGLCHAEENYKEHSARIDTQLSEIDPMVFVEDPVFDIDEPVVYRIFACPSCGTAFENELTLESAPSIWDIQIDVASIDA
jgi:N-methylhydantoinase B